MKKDVIKVLKCLLENNWTEVENRKAFLIDFAKARGFDPLVIENWNRINPSTLKKTAVCLFFWFILFFLFIFLPPLFTFFVIFSLNILKQLLQYYQGNLNSALNHLLSKEHTSVQR